MAKIKPFKFGKNIRIEYIPFSQLLDPHFAVKDLFWSLDREGASIRSIPLSNSRSLNTIKKQELEALISSIQTFGLLKPLDVVKMTEDMKKELNERGHILDIHRVTKAKYVIIDGQRRYFAIKEWLRLRNEKEYNATNPYREGIYASPIGIEDYILLPCIVYPYKSFSESRRHSIEDNKFSVRPKGIYLDHAERIGMGIPNIIPKEHLKIHKTFNQIASKRRNRPCTSPKSSC